MAYYRKKRAPTIRKKRVYKRRVMRRVPRSLAIKPATLAIKRRFFFQTWSPNTVTTNDFWKALFLNLSQIPNHADVVNMFDQYKICAIKWTFMPHFSSFDGANTTDTTLPGVTDASQPIFHVCYDTRTTVSPSGVYSTTTLNNFFEQGRIKTVKNSLMGFDVYAKPSIYGMNVAGVSTNMWTAPKWLPTTSANIAHNCPNVFCQFTDSANAQAYDMFATVYLMCRNQK